MRFMPLGELILSSRSGFASGKRAADGAVQLRMNNVSRDGALSFDSVTRVPASVKQLRELSLRAGDVLFNCTNSPELVGKTCLFRGHPEPVVFSNHFLRLRTKGDLLVPDYLARWLAWTRARGIFSAGCVRWVNQATYKKEDLLALRIPLPPLPEQKRIAAILDAADALRAKRRESIEPLDALVQATFLEMFGDPVTNPKGWPVYCLRDIANDSFRNGLSPSTKGSVAGQVLTLGAITTGTFLFVERKSACFDRPPAEAQTLSERTFLICRGNGNRELVGVGAFPDRTSTDVCFPDTMIGVTPDCGIVHGRYLHRIWNSRCVRTQVEGMARTTNGTYKVNQQMLATVAMPLPPLDLQTRFAAIVESIEQQKARLKAHLAELDTLFASLQSRAFNGELVA